jgi:hypothetical protein
VVWSGGSATDPVRRASAIVDEFGQPGVTVLVKDRIGPVVEPARPITT